MQSLNDQASRGCTVVAYGESCWSIRNLLREFATKYVRTYRAFERFLSSETQTLIKTDYRDTLTDWDRGCSLCPLIRKYFDGFFIA